MIACFMCGALYVPLGLWGPFLLRTHKFILICNTQSDAISLNCFSEKKESNRSRAIEFDTEWSQTYVKNETNFVL
jgi:hypothetical protein